ncbi:MAG: bifunctional ADP-heptose synthase [Bacteroidales bacterium]
MFEGFDFPGFFKRIRNKRVLIIGDVMIDTYLWGKVERVSPEAPVPIVSEIIEESRLGGAANVALNVKALGAVPILCSVIGGDERGSLFIDLMEEQNLSDVGITVDDYRVTTKKTRVIAGFKHLLRIDEEIENTLSKRVQNSFVELVVGLIETGGIDAIIFQDYDKGVVTKAIISRVVNLANKMKIPVMADPKYRNFMEYSSIAIYKPNLKEFVKGVKSDASKTDVARLAGEGERLRSNQNIDALMVTLSSNGILVVDASGYLHLPVVKREVTDVSGAGDTVISVLALCHSCGMGYRQSAAVANLAGGQVCEKSGVVPVDREQLERECSENL